MEHRYNERKLKYIVDFLYCIIIVLVVYFALRYALPLLFPFVCAAMISVIAEPSVRFLVRKLKFNRTAASVICITFFLFIAIAAAAIISATAFNKIKCLYDSIPQYTEGIKRYFANLEVKKENFIITPVEKGILKAFEYLSDTDIYSVFGGNVGRYVFGYVSGVVSSIPSLLLSLVITFVSAVFISASFDGIKRFVLLQFDGKRRDMLLETKKICERVLKKYVKSYLSIMLVTFGELTLFFLIFDMRPAASIALAIAAVDILPVLGVGTVMIPWALICMATGGLNKGLILLSIYAVVTVVRQIIEPKIVGGSIGLHPVATLISVYVGLKLFGIIGMILAPLSLIMVRELQSKGYLHLWREKKVDNGNR